ncbi:hypothetical protein ACNF42_08150 [Cuniculiplasma sp. SKW3]|uniref:hypothetical protein n=1 Tax=Cuniculiplasma sp. SKW3 TaxID=3400170 RepID=UPI003FD55843
MGKIENFLSHFIIRAEWNRRNRIIFGVVSGMAIIYYCLAILLNQKISDVISVKIFSILLIGSLFIMFYAVKGVKWVDKATR